MDQGPKQGPVVPGFEPSWLQPSSADLDFRTAAVRKSRHRVLLPVVMAVVVGIGLAVIALFVLGRPSIPGAGVAPAAFVVSASRTTLAQRTADITVSGSVTAAGHSIPIIGAGQANFSNPQQFSATVDVDPANDLETLTEREIVTNNQFYLALSGDGQDVSTFVPGKHWVTIPIPLGAGSSLGTGTSDPLAQLRLLASQGNTVKSLGTNTISGVTTSGYSVTLSRRALINAELRYLTTSDLTPAEQQQIGQEARNLEPPTMAVWFDSSSLVRRMSYAMTQTEDGISVVVKVDMDFVNYGAAVSISAPSPSDVASYSQFVAAAQAASGSGASAST